VQAPVGAEALDGLRALSPEQRIDWLAECALPQRLANAVLAVLQQVLDAAAMAPEGADLGEALLALAQVQLGAIA